MTEERRASKIEDMSDLDLLIGIGWENRSYDAHNNYLYKLREDSGDTEETVFIASGSTIIDDNSVISDGTTTVSEWKTATGATYLRTVEQVDQSRAGNTVSQATPGYQPKFTLNGVGVPATIDGTTPEFLYKTLTTGVSLEYPSSVFIVFNPTNTGANNWVFSGTETTGIGTYRLLISSAGELLFGSTSDNNTSSNSFFGNVSLENNNLVSLIIDGTTNIKGYLNSLLKFDFNPAGGFTCKYDKYNIGRVYGNKFTGSIKEVVIFKRVLTSNEQDIVEKYLMNENGIS